MITFEIQGAIFDVDDTLLDNKPDIHGATIHEKSRLAAIHDVGKLHNIKKLATLSYKDNLNAFLKAPVHTLEGAVWNILFMTGIVDSKIINLNHPLLKEIIQIKNDRHKDLLLREGREVPGAVAFVKTLAANGLEDKLAIASTAIMRDIDIFLTKSGLTHLFPKSRIVSRESITQPKPNPEAFNLAFLSFNIPKEQKKHTCAFEDDPRGIIAAKSAGLFTCAITTRYSKKTLLSLENPPDLVAESFQEFAEQFGIVNEFTTNFR